MENSMDSMSKVISSNESISDTHDVSPEESGWTMYFDDFFNQHNNENSCFSSGLESSLISDAASSVLKNKVADNHEQATGFSQEKNRDRLSFKKRKAKVVAIDDDLEDTASSPANSPKVCNLMSQYMNRKPEQMDINSPEKANSSSAQMEERNAVGSAIGGENNNETELKKRGLCLVPLSMIVDYLG